MTETQCPEHSNNTVGRCFSGSMTLFEDSPPLLLNPSVIRDIGSVANRISVSRNGDGNRPDTSPIADKSTKIKIDPVASRPSTAYNKTRLLYDDEPCPSPVVRQSQDNMDVHEALRSRVPPFRQSRRWAKAYTAPNVPCTPTTVTRKPSVGKHSRGFSCDMTRCPQLSEIDNPVQRSDTESDHYHHGCKPVAVPGWHSFKQRRLLKRHSIPSKNSRNTGHRSPRRAKSTKSLTSAFQTSPRRAGLPKLVQSSSVAWLRQQNQTQNSLIHQDICDATETSQLLGPHDAIGGRGSGDPEHRHSPVQSLHDLQKMKRFSQECVDILALDSGDNWHLSVFGPPLPTSPEKSVEIRTSRQSRPSDQTCDTCNNRPPSLAPRYTDKAPDPPMRTSSKRGGGPGPTGLKQIAKPACFPVPESFRDTSLHAAHDADDEADDHLSLLRQSSRRERSKTGCSQQIKLKHMKDLKTVRSVDTLSRIEAQVVHTRSNVSLPRLRGMTISARPASPNTKTPSGQPPERPLPELPKVETPTIFSTYRNPPLINGCESHVFGAITKVQADACKISPIHTMLEIPSHPISCVANTASVEQHVTSPNGCTSAGSSCLTERVAMSVPIDRQNFQSSSVETGPYSVLKVKGITNDRSSRIQEIKKRHLAAWSKAAGTGDTQNIPGDKDAPVRAQAQGHDLEPKCHTHRATGPYLNENQRPAGSDKSSVIKPSFHKSDDVFGVNELDKFPSVPLTLSSSQSAYTSDLKPPQDLNRKLSRKSSRSQRHSTEGRSIDNSSSLKRSQESANKARSAKQNLEHSQIMVVVDTNPHTSSFRAGAISPNPHTVRAASRPASPIVKGPTKSNRPSTCKSFTARVDDAAQFTSAAVPENSYLSQGKPSLHRMRHHQLDSQNSVTRSGLHNLPHVLPALTNPRPGSVQCHYFINDDSSSEREGVSLSKQKPVNSSHQSLKTPRRSIRKSHRRQDTPTTVMLKEGVQQVGQELDDLRKYERHFEYVQAHLEETLELWSRMTPGDKRQFMASNFSTIDAQNDADKNSGINLRAMTTATSSIYSNRSSADRLKRGNINKMDQDSIFMKDKAIEDHRTSKTSDLLTGTSTDTDNSIENYQYAPGKRISDGSLTDPQDYGITTALLQNRANTNGKTGCPGLTNTHTHPALSRPRSDPACNTHVSISHQPKPCPTPIMSQEGFMSPQERAEVVPWEQHEHVVANAGSSTDTLGNHRLSVNHAIFRTDQMDALLML